MSSAVRLYKELGGRCRFSPAVTFLAAQLTWTFMELSQVDCTAGCLTERFISYDTPLYGRSTGRASGSRVNTRSGPLAVTRSRSGMLCARAAGVPHRGGNGCPDRTSSRRIVCRLVHVEEFGHGVAQGLGAVVWAVKKRHLRHRVAQHPRSDRVPFGMVGIEEAVGRCLIRPPGPASIPDSPHPAHRC